MPPSKSKSQGGKPKDWGDFTDSDSDVGSDGPGPKDELNDAEGEEAMPVQHPDGTQVSSCSQIRLPCSFCFLRSQRGVCVAQPHSSFFLA